MEIQRLKMLRHSFVVAVIFLVTKVKGHGRLIEPPSRSSMWRYGFDDSPKNWNDNELFCGGFMHQQSLDGKCGVCGDPWDGVRENEAGGKYAQGVIVRQYKKAQDIEIRVELTANHMGWFEFRLCPVNDKTVKATLECLDLHKLEQADGSGSRFKWTEQVNKVYSVTYRLPADLVCTQCVLQWKYHAGNTWGTDPDGTSCVGCGPQEEFYGCADISISADGEPATPGSTVKPITDAPWTTPPATQGPPTTKQPPVEPHCLP